MSRLPITIGEYVEASMMNRERHQELPDTTLAGTPCAQRAETGRIREW